MKETSNKIFVTTVSFTLLGILAILSGIFYQLDKINDFNRANLTNEKEKEVLQWEKENPEAQAWIFNPDSSLKRNYDRWHFDDYLGIYEDIYSLEERNLVDKKLSYDFFSSTLETIYEANNFELKRMIDSMRIKDNDPEDYVGVEHLYNEWEKDRKTVSGEHNPPGRK